MSPSFSGHYPWTKQPVIANAAMAGLAGVALATEVSRAGGVGFIGGGSDMKKLNEQVSAAKSLLKDLKVPDQSILPIGVGFLVFFAKLEEAVAVIALHHPAVIWLSCPTQLEDLEVWCKAMRKASPSSMIWIQIASVFVALSVASTCSPDVLIMQGADAGGHGPFPGAGIVSLVPETRDALDNAGFSDIGIFAAGGISDGRGVAAAVACGADGVVMGTRFLASQEIELSVEEYSVAILQAKDGGVSTVRATVFDELKGESIWPSQYDGRAIIGASYRDMKDGVGIAELRNRYTVAEKESHKGFGGEMRAPIWAGTGVGLVTEIKTAGEIVDEVRSKAESCLKKAIKSLD